MRMLYHLVRADFLERSRRYSFLVTLAAAVYLGYCSITGKVVVQLEDYRGVYNSAWIGCLMTLVATTFLSLVGFYIVKNTILRDQETGVGQILATTPMTKSFYTIAKAISNFAVLSAMVGVMALAALLMQYLKAEDTHVQLGPLLLPFLLFALPAMFFTGALAVLFETLPILRGGAGNVIFFFVWTALIALPIAPLANGGRVGTATYFSDATGLVSIMGQMQEDLRTIDPLYKNGAQLTIGERAATRTFLWTGLRLRPAVYWSRAACLMLSIAIALLGASFFHRFDPGRRWDFQKVSTGDSADVNVDVTTTALPAQTQRHLTPIAHTGSATRMLRLVLAELKLMLKGHRWWWYAIAGGIFIASVASPPAAPGAALAALIWPVLVWSQMGTREARFNTTSLIFSAEHSVRRQLPAVWIAGIVVAAVTNSGFAIRLLSAGHRQGLMSWLASTLFVPSLALAFGVWSNTSKLFEAVYTAWWYVGPAHQTPGLDFLGTTVQSARPQLYLAMTLALVVAAYLGRRAKLAYT